MSAKLSTGYEARRKPGSMRSRQRNQVVRAALTYNPAPVTTKYELFCLPIGSGTQNNACRHANIET
jgi:hypothetical protein